MINMALIGNWGEIFCALLFSNSAEYKLEILEAYVQGKNRIILVRYLLMYWDSLFQSFHMHLLLKTQQGHDQDGKE